MKKFFRFVFSNREYKIVAILFSSVIVLTISILSVTSLNQHTTILGLLLSKQKLTGQLQSSNKALFDLKNQDQYKINQSLALQIKTTHDDYTKSIDLYQQILDLRSQKQDTKKMDNLYGNLVKDLSDLKYASAESKLTDLDKQIAVANVALLAAQLTNPVGNAPVSNAPPASGFSLQQVTSDVGTFPIAIISADLNSTRVIVDTASEGDCGNNCPVLPLGDYVSRNGAFAGINGTFFCPSDYPSCAGKTNSFDTLLMNKKKTYFNSSNNVYSSVPLVYFTGNSMGVRGASSGWGRDTGVDSVIAMQPLLVTGGNIVYGGGGSDKFGAKGLRSFIGNKGSTVYIGFVYNATMSEGAHVLKALGLENALNLDEGGSSALWSGGYKVGPGRSIPNAVLFVRK